MKERCDSRPLPPWWQQYDYQNSAPNGPDLRALNELQGRKAPDIEPKRQPIRQPLRPDLDHSIWLPEVPQQLPLVNLARGKSKSVSEK